METFDAVFYYISDWTNAVPLLTFASLIVFPFLIGIMWIARSSLKPFCVKAFMVGVLGLMVFGLFGFQTMISGFSSVPSEESADKMYAGINRAAGERFGEDVLVEVLSNDDQFFVADYDPNEGVYSAELMVAESIAEEGKAYDVTVELDGTTTFTEVEGEDDDT